MLNRAHFLHRQAEKAARKGNVEEAIQLHKEAADILRDLLQSVINEKVQESLRLQAELHEKEQVVLNNQRRRAIKVYKNLEKLRTRMNDDDQSSTQTGGGSVLGSPSISRGRVNGNSGRNHDTGFATYYHYHQPAGGPLGHGARPSAVAGDSLQVSIYRKFEETESLLDQLRIQDDSSDQWRGGGGLASNVSTPRRHLQTFSATPVALPPPAASDINTASKRPKDDKVIIEELQIANCHLRKMVDSLFLELNNCQRENKELKQRVRHLEGQIRERVHGEDEGEQPPQPAHTCRRGHRSGSGHRSMAGSMSSLAQQPPAELPALDMPAFDFQH